MVTDHDCGGSTLHFYCVHAVVRGTDGRVWSVAAPMKRAQCPLGRAFRVQCDRVTIVLLCDAVRRAGAVHICDDRCDPHRRHLRVKHSASVVEGGLYELWTRADGYPPHMG